MLSDAAQTGGGAWPDAGTALSVRGVGKCYEIYPKPRDRLKQTLLGRWRTYYRPFWALSGVSFEIEQGDAVGIVGRNGSGKSTLLQIIAGTLPPTTGEAIVRGRVAALLELGSGFNPEFTGRENVYLNGAILGIPKREMHKRFDEIADFADIGDFIDQPVRFYSSGMHARLAFAVAVAVDPDILILDEILAVGDVGFQQKCIARMKRLLDRGVTLLYVSHSPDSVKSICNKGLFIDAGKAEYFGDAEHAVDLYFSRLRTTADQHAAAEQRALARPIVPGEDGAAARLRYGSGLARIDWVRLLDENDQPVRAFRLGERITAEIGVTARTVLDEVRLSVSVRDSAGVDLFGAGTTDAFGCKPVSLLPGRAAVARFRFENILRPGSYGITLDLSRDSPDGTETLDHVDGGVAFTTIGDGRRNVDHKILHPIAVEWTAQDAARGLEGARSGG